MDTSVLRLAWNRLLPLLGSYKLLLIVAAACILPLNTLYRMKTLWHWQDATVMDGLLYEFGLFTIHYLILVPLFLFMIYDIVKPDLMEPFLFCRLGSRKKLFFSKILSCVFAVLAFLLILLFCGGFVLAFQCRLTPKWSDSLLSAQGLRRELMHPSLAPYAPIPLLLFQSVLLFLSLTATGWLALFFMEIIKRKALVLVLMLLLNFTLLLLARASSAALPVLPCANTFLVNIDVGVDGIWAIARPALYWLILGGLSFACDAWAIARKDFLYEAASENDA